MSAMQRSNLWLLVLVGLSACSGTEVAIFEPDPRLQESQQTSEPTSAQTETDPQAGKTAAGQSSSPPAAALADRFPETIPLYPQRGPLHAQNLDPDGRRGEVSWELPANPSEALEFYASELPAAGWTLAETAPPETLIARRDALQLHVTARDRRLTLRYQTSVAALESDTPPIQGAIATTPLAAFEDLDAAPAPLRDYVQAVAALEILTPIEPQTRRFAPAQPIRRRTFARWLVAAHATFWQDRPEWQIRPATAREPIFTDVPATDPDFATIQTLAVAGIVPSTLGTDGDRPPLTPTLP